MTTQFDRYKSALDKAKLKIWGYPWPETKKSPIMGIRVVNNNVWMEAWLNHEKEAVDVGRRPATARMDPIIFGVFEELMSKVIRTDKPMRLMVGNNTAERDKPGAKIKDSCIYIGRDDGGTIYIELEVRNRPTSKYPLINNAWYHMEVDGKPLTRNVASTLVAKSWLKRVSSLVDQVLVTNHVDEQMLKRERDEKDRKRKAEEQDTATFSSGLPDDFGNLD